MQLWHRNQSCSDRQPYGSMASILAFSFGWFCPRVALRCLSFTLSLVLPTSDLLLLFGCGCCVSRFLAVKFLGA
uniref:Uncharacterized protein n=1 Tax=Manihot esculenta TaxID=3983 RepID=A0A2C9VZY4_MANES